MPQSSPSQISRNPESSSKRLSSSSKRRSSSSSEKNSKSVRKEPRVVRHPIPPCTSTKYTCSLLGRHPDGDLNADGSEYAEAIQEAGPDMLFNPPHFDALDDRQDGVREIIMIRIPVDFNVSLLQGLQMDEDESGCLHVAKCFGPDKKYTLAERSVGATGATRTAVFVPMNTPMTASKDGGESADGAASDRVASKNRTHDDGNSEFQSNSNGGDDSDGICIIGPNSPARVRFSADVSRDRKLLVPVPFQRHLSITEDIRPPANPQQADGVVRIPYASVPQRTGLKRRCAGVLPGEKMPKEMVREKTVPPSLPGTPLESSQARKLNEVGDLKTKLEDSKDDDVKERMKTKKKKKKNKKNT
mmetsp:Transcript_19873/g.39633  ORF Transcript_19873/g.39633 Transcript_19873/m.39633 type:complete len:359 (+) Transcript_19873:19-1095(+)